MNRTFELTTLDGARELHNWFGYWPSFHDGEILRLELNRSGPSTLAIHTWEAISEVDGNGYNVSTKHLVVDFVLEGISDLELAGFSHQNVVGSLDIDKTDVGWRLTLSPIYGLAGTIEASRISIILHPGKP
jgi:hypothetical protein